MIFKTISDESTISGQKVVSILQARKISQQQITAQLEMDVACLKQYEIACQSGSVSTVQFDSIMKKASITAKEYTTNIKAGTGSAQSYAQVQKTNNAVLQSVGIGAGIASKSVKLLSVTMNTIASTAIFSLIAKGISWVTDQFNNYIHHNQIAIEKAEELIDTFKSDLDSIYANQDKIAGYANEFKQLSEGVDDLGRNVSLAADEYSRYQNIVKEIVGINPSLILGYDDENNVLADKNGLISTSIQLLKDEYNQKLKILALPNNVDTAIEGAVGRYDTAKKKFLDVEIPTSIAFSGVRIDKNGNRESGYVNQISQYIEDIIGVEFTGWEGGINQYILDNAEAVFNNLDKIKERAAQTKNGWEGLSDSQLIDLMDYFKELQIIYNDMNNAASSANPTLQYVAMAEESYSDLSNIQKRFVADYINGIKITPDTTKQEKNAIRKSIISLTQELANSNDMEMENALVNLYAMPTDKQSIDEFVKQFRSALEIIKRYCQENGIEIPAIISDGEQKVNDLEVQYKNTINMAKDKFDGYDPTKFFKEHSINTKEELDAWQKVAQEARDAAEAEKDYIQSLVSKDENSTLKSFREIWDSLDGTGNDWKDLKDNLLELAKAGKLTVKEFNKTSGAKTWLKKIGISAEDAVNKINKLKEVSSSDQLVSMGNGIKSLSDNLTTKRDNPGQAISYDTLTGMSDELKECTVQWKKYEKVMGTASSTYKDCSKATDELATAFVNSNNFLANLTASTKQYYISQLSTMGISNAEEIVTDLLAQKHREAAAAKQTESLKNEVLAITKNGVTNETLKEVNMLFQQEHATKLAQYALVDLIAQEQILSNTSLSFDDKISSLNTLATQYLGVAAAASFMSKIQTSSEGALSSGETITAEEAWAQTISEQKKALNQPIIYTPPAIAISPSHNSVQKATSSKNNAEKPKESKQEIDWLSRMLDILQKKADLLKAKFEDMFSLGRKKTNLFNQIKETTKLFHAQEKAAFRYQKLADNFFKKNKKKLSKNGIKLSMLQNGSYDLKSYNSSIANIIQTYEEYYDKAQESRKATLELSKAIKELSKQKLELTLDNNERKRTYQEAKYANATTTNAKHKILNKEINTYKADDKAYEEYFKETKQLRKKNKKSAKTAVNKTKELGEKTKDKIKKLIKQGKKIPSALMKKVKSADESTYWKLVNYNNSLDFVSDALREKKLANEENKANRREKRVERAQVHADDREAHYDLNQKRAENVTDAKTKNKYEAESLKNKQDQYKWLKEIAKLEHGEKSAEYKLLQEEEKSEVRAAYKRMYDNIKSEYDNLTSLNDAQIATVQAKIATLEAAGKSASKEMYMGMVKLSSDTEEKLLKERAELEESGKNLEAGSDEWYAWKNDMESLEQSLYSCKQNTIEWQKAINELDLKKFSLMAAQLDATKSHLDFLVGMLSHQDLTNKESGGLTDAGFATISLRFSSIDNQNRMIENAREKLKKIYENHLNGTDGLTEEEFLEAKERELDVIRNSLEAIADEKDAILDLVDNAMQVQIDSINELIEKKKKALATEKDLYEYQKKVAKQTNNIALIQKQIAALSGDNSEEARAKLQKLQVSLEEAQEDLKDTEYDRWHDDQSDMLDSLSEEVENFWERIMNDLRRDINGSMDRLMQMVTDNPEAITRALNALGLGDALSVITTYNKDGTHTEQTIDYGGTSYESTHENNTGNNVNNQLDTDIKNQDSPSGDTNSSSGNPENIVGDIAGATDEEIKHWAEKILQNKLEKEKEKKLEEEEQKKREEAKQLVYQRADDIMHDKANGQMNGIAIRGVISKQAVRDVVEEFLNSSALHKPTTEAGKQRMKTDPLLKYIAEIYSGKTLSNANEALLGAYLGIQVKDKNNVTTKEANKILKAFQSAGFAKGGIASGLNEAVIRNGDDGLITVKRGESILTVDQTERFQKLTDNLDLLNGMTEYAPQIPDYSHMVDCRTVNSPVTVGDVSIHLDGSNIVDKETFRRTLREYDVRSDIEQIALGDIPTGTIRNSLKKI